MSCPASAGLLQGRLLSTLHSSESYVWKFSPAMQRRTGLQCLQNGLFLQRLLNNGAEKTYRHQTAVLSEAAASPNAGGDNLFGPAELKKNRT